MKTTVEHHDLSQRETKEQGAALDESASRPDSAEQGRSRRQMSWRKIIVPVDFTTSTLKALEYAGALATSFGSTIHLLHVVEPTSLVAGVEGLPFSKWREAVTRESRVRMRHLAERCLPPSVPVEIQVDSGMVGLGIIRAVETLGGDLVILTTSGMHGLKHLLSQNTAEWVMLDAPCPVLVLHCAEPVALDLGHGKEPGEPSGVATPAWHSAG